MLNNMQFSKKQLENGELTEFIQALLKHTYDKDSDMYNNIHIYPDGNDNFILEWSQEYWNDKYGLNGKFVYLESDQYVMKEYIFPDNHIEYFHCDEEYEDAINEWLKEHKEERWKKNEYGRWYSEKEQELYRKELGLDKDEEPKKETK